MQKQIKPGLKPEKAIELLNGKSPRALPIKWLGFLGRNRQQIKITTRKKWLRQLRENHKD